MTTKQSAYSTLGSSIDASITMSVTALANQLKKEGKSVISMSAGEPDFDTPDYIKSAAIEAIQNGKTKYTAAAGLPELKSAICEKFKADQHLDFTPDQIVVSCGAKHTIFNILMATINPGDEVIIPTPYWVSYPDQVALLGGTPVFVHTSDESQFKITPEQLKSAITDRTKMVILNSPSNPTGMVYTRDELQALADVIVANDIWVLSDEIYEKLVYAQEHVSIAQLGSEIAEKTLLVNGHSKAFSMTGWRIGYCAVPSSLATVMSRIQSHTTSNPVSFSQWGAIAALTTPLDAVYEMRDAFQRRRDLLVDGLNAIDGIRCIKPEGAFYAFPNISELLGRSTAAGPIKDSVAFCQQLLQDQLIAAVPGSGFGADDYIRLSYATSDDAIKQALDRLQTFVKGLN